MTRHINDFSTHLFIQYFFFKKQLTFTSFPVCYWFRWIPVIALFTIMTMSPCCEMSAL